MRPSHRTRLALLALVTLACIVGALALAGCGRVSSMLGVQPPPEARNGSASGSGPAAAEKAIDYASLISAADIERITGVNGVTEMPPGMRAGDSLHYVLFTSPKTPEFVSFRVGKPGMYDEQLKLLRGAETKLTIGGEEAMSWASKDMAESGIAIRMPGSTYMVVTRWLFKTPEGKPQLTDEQLKQVAEMAVARSR